MFPLSPWAPHIFLKLSFEGFWPLDVFPVMIALISLGLRVLDRERKRRLFRFLFHSFAHKPNFIFM